MAKQAARIHFHAWGYLTKRKCRDWAFRAPGCAGSASRKIFASAFGGSKTSGLKKSEALRYPAIAAPNKIEIAAMGKVRPPPTIPRIRPQTVEKLTKVTPAESHFIASAPFSNRALCL